MKPKDPDVGGLPDMMEEIRRSGPHYGKRFGDVVLDYAIRNPEERDAQIRASMAELSEDARRLVPSWMDDMARLAPSEAFWRQDYGAAMRHLSSAAEAKLATARIRAAFGDPFNLSQIALYTFAAAAHEPRLRFVILRALGHGFGKMLLGWLMGVGLFGRFLGTRPSLLVTALCCAWGTLGRHPHLWIPYSSLLAGIIAVPMLPWIMSDRLGAWTRASIILKLVVTVSAVYAMVSLPASILLAIWWLVRSQ